MRTLKNEHYRNQGKYLSIQVIDKALLYCFFCLITFFGASITLKGQSQLIQTIQIEPIYGVEKLKLNKTYFLSKGDSLQFTKLRFYISNISLLDSNQIIFEESNSFHLVDIEAKNSLKISLGIPEKLKYTALSFSIGIDSTTNSGGVMGGDLDPTKGMYWTWQSGYINFKLEGISPLCDTYFNEFQYHIGGYQAPNNTFQTVILPVKNEEGILKIKLNIKDLMEHLDLAKQHSIMTPGTKATQLSKLLPTLFKKE